MPVPSNQKGQLASRRRARFVAVVAAAAMATAVGGITAVVALGQHYHTNCVGHGFVHGSSTTDNAFWARVEGGCGNPGSKVCVLRTVESNEIDRASIPAGSGSTCNAWSNYEFGELASTAWVDFNGVFSSHYHVPH